MKIGLKNQLKLQKLRVVLSHNITNEVVLFGPRMSETITLQHSGMSMHVASLFVNKMYTLL